MREIREIRQRYVEKDLNFDRYSDHTNELVSEGLREGLRDREHKKASEIAIKMFVGGIPLEEIAEYSGLTKEEVEAIKTSASHEDLSKPKKKSESMKTSASHEDLCKP